MGKLVVTDHPLIQHKLTILRDKNTSSKDFRQLVTEMSALMGYEVTRDLELRDIEVETPLEKTIGKEISGKKIGIVPILRAGLGMVDGVLSVVPGARVGHIGMYRDPESLKPVTYYSKFPKDIEERTIILLDPMLATGGSLIEAIDEVKRAGATSIRTLNILAAPEGIKVVQEAHPDVDIYVASVERELNDHAYILPGLGDAGDRLFGTK
ncbi:uracil phosphoribosyltransferase [Peptoniphilus asaccharolyticus DSM 20463]|uniref:Uracil phosphoribosyltransferase n=1 Tax=Peptoniphilus asaccharolyticus DSM 20463 TaxID=573058 RepID=A0A1W1VKN4_PEPAS|nr:uracil phosphoribosyltransferase [Peptoniphilus asaccharolyticus]MBL7574467.1 uracil phosphoribosyltransferase [Peptoniphilus asaccharolyticus]SMB93866.1 uracil phosphoribosyltransferase [Peptoniphilus asaccharolyticus DSM 20463]